MREEGKAIDELRALTSYCTGNGVKSPSPRESHMLLYVWVGHSLSESAQFRSLTEYSTSGLVLYSLTVLGP